MAKKATSTPTLKPSMRIVALHGSERFLIEEHSRELAGLLEKEFGGVGTFSFDGETVEPAAVLDELRTFGLMHPHKLVIVENADVFLSGKKKGEEEDVDEEDSAGSRRPLVERYAENPCEQSTLLFRSTGWRKGKLDKLIGKQGTIIVCKEFSSADAARWCVNRCKNTYCCDLPREAASLLVERLGTPLLHLDSELAKLSALAGDGGKIDLSLVKEMVGLSREEKAWEIQSAVVTGDAAIMIRKFRELLDISRQDIVPISWAVMDILRKLFAASVLIRRGTPPGDVARHVRLWGAATQPTLAIARRVKPQQFAQLMRHAVTTDKHSKTGIGDPVRSLEALMVRIADSLQPD